MLFAISYSSQKKKSRRVRFFCNRSVRPAINAIVRTFQKRTAAGLQSGRDFVIPDKQEQATESSDFELVTWLVIKGDRL